MNVYKQEILDGVGEAVKATASVAYCTQASVSTHHDPSPVIDKIVAANANPQQVDLYYIKSVLVSTGWNKNDDVFSPEITFAARNTPEDKQFNFMHDENDIIGHITGSYVVDRNGDRIVAEEAPAEFDIITEAVLYNSWTDPENRMRMNSIIAEIEQGKWFVSMECLFDYALISPEGTHTTVARNEDSAFLTKHLRAYGGTGEYEKYKVGRSLRGISFSGKGLVNKPANPRSYIIDSSEDKITDDHAQHSLSFPQGDINMSEEVKTEAEEVAVASEEVVETTTTEETVAVQPDAVPEKPAEEPAPAVEEEAAPAEEAAEEAAPEAEEVAEEAAPEAEAEAAEDKCCESKDCDCDGAKAEADETVVALEAKIAELTSELEAAKLTIAGYVEAEEAAKAAEKMEAKKATLAEAGVTGEEAEAILALSIDDETFATIVAAFAAKVEVKEDETVEVKADESLVSESSDDTETEAVTAEAEEVSEEELFEEVSSTEATLIDASEDQSELDLARAAVSDWLTNNVLSK